MALLSGLLAYLNALLGVIAILCLIILFLYLPVKISFFFPSKATESGYSLRDLMKMMKGFYWKVTTTIFLVTFIGILLLVPVGILVTIVTPIFSFGLGEAALTQYGGAVFNILGKIFIEPIFIVFYVMTLSNYFAIAKQQYQDS